MPTTHRVGSSGRRHTVKPVDQIALRELDLFAENTGEIYKQKQAIIANLQKKRAKGKYDPAKAPKLWAYWVDEAARRYQKDFGSGSPIFDRATKNALAEELAKRYEHGEDI
jgi:transposase